MTTKNSTSKALLAHEVSVAIAIVEADTVPPTSSASVAGTLTNDTANAQARAMRSQPIVLPGRRIARNAPTAAYGATARAP